MSKADRAAVLVLFVGVAALLADRWGARLPADDAETLGRPVEGVAEGAVRMLEAGGRSVLDVTTELQILSLVHKGVLGLPTGEFVNVRNLEFMSEVELARSMAFFTRSLGVKCQFCHLPGDYTSDERFSKQMAREMVSMLQTLNREYFAEDPITCYTCHRGADLPQRLPEGTARIPRLFSRQEVEPGPGEFENVQLLKHLDADELEDVMNFFTEALGVTCSTCHVVPRYPLDDKPEKLRAREMIRMVQHVNRDIFHSSRVSCHTCHAGGEHPARFPEDWLTKTAPGTKEPIPNDTESESPRSHEQDRE